MKKIIIKSLIAVFAIGLLVVSSCKKQEPKVTTDAVRQDASTQALDQKVRKLLSRLPVIKMDNSQKQGVTYRRHNMSKDGGWNFSDPSADQTAYSDLNGTIYVSSSAFGSNTSSSGTVVAGPSSLDINYTFCFSYDAGQNALGGSLFSSTGAPVSGLSGVIGVSGDFSNLQNSDSSTNFSDIFKGLAFYFVYDGTPSGQYDVIDWTNHDWNDTSSFDKMCFAFIFDFKNGRLFLSSGGTIDVNGGSMMYNGQYLEVSGFLDSQGNYNLNGNLSYQTVTGFGTMGCN